MKYLIVKAPFPADEEVITFSDCVDHSWMAKNFQVISAGKLNIYPACPPTSPIAGPFGSTLNVNESDFCPQISVFHGSTTLKIERDAEREEEDRKLVEHHLKPRY